MPDEASVRQDSLRHERMRSCAHASVSVTEASSGITFRRHAPIGPGEGFQECDAMLFFP